MACCHQHNHQPSPNSCSHNCSPPAPPLDPLLLQSIVSLLLHHYPTPSAAAFPGSARSPLDHQSCCSDLSEHHNRKGSPSPHQPSEHLSQAKCSAHSSLLQRMDLLESSFQRFSSAPSPDTALSLRNLAARRIQARFRTFLVRRSRAFRRLKELTSVNSALDKIKLLDSSSASPPKIIQDGDKTTIDSKWLISRAFVEFLEQVEGICVRGNGVISTIKDIIPVGIDKVSQVSCASKESEVVGHDEKGSEHCNLDKNGKRMIYNLRERLRRIREISEDVEDKDESRDFRGAEEHDRLQSNPENRVQFIEDENATKVHNSDGTELTIIVSDDVKKIEDTVEKQQDGVEVENDGEKNPAESFEGSEDEVETENEDDGSEDEYETEDEGSEDEYESENEVSEDEIGDCRGAEKHNRLQSNAEKHVRFIEDTNTRVYNSDGNFKEPRLSDNAKRIEETVEKQHNDREVEGDDEKNPAESFEGSEDEAETENENENCEHEYETENEGSEDDYETENEVCDDEDKDETENEGSECGDETEYEEDEDCSHESETEEDEGSEIVDETENVNHNDIPQNNKDNGIAVHPVETNLTYQELLVHAQLMRQQILAEKNAETTHNGQGSGSHRRHLRNVLCHVCFKRGHMRRECWYNPSRLCKKCHTIGHAQEVCAIVSNQ